MAAPAIPVPDEADVTVPFKVPVGPLVQLGNLNEPMRVWKLKLLVVG